MNAWDLAALVARLKGRGLDMTEAMAMMLVEESLGWIHDSIVASDTKFDDFALPALPLLEKPLKDLADKINGKKDLP